MKELSPVTIRCRHTIARIALGFFAFFAAAILGQVGLVLLFEWLAPAFAESVIFTWLASLLPMYLLGAPLLYLSVRKLPRAVPTAKRLRARDFLVLLLIAYAAMYLTNLIGTAINAMTELILGGSSQSGATELISSSALWISVPVAVIIAPILEELLFRKLILSRLLPFGEGFAVLVSAVLFGLFHGNLAQMPYAIAVGLVFGLVVARTGRVRDSIFMHATLNFLGTVPASLLMPLLKRFESLDPSAEIATEELLILLGSLLLLLVYLGIVFILVGLGVFFFIRHRRTFIPRPAAEPLPRGERLSVLISPAVILYAVAILFLFVLSYL